MERPVTVQRTEGIAVLTIDNPPGNALSASVRAALAAAVQEEDQNADTRAIVLAGRGKAFAGPPDLRDFDRPPEKPSMSDLCAVVEASGTPVVAALHGTVSGEALELALAAHYRIADRRAQFGAPAILMGHSPGAGGTQRLPRLVGAAHAADILLAGRSIDAVSAEKIGLVDAVADESLPRFTLRHVVDELSAGRLPVRRTGEIGTTLKPAKTHLDALQQRRERASALPLPAGGKILDCIEAAILLPFDAGLSFERAVHEDLLASPEARALRHVVVAERRAQVAPVAEPGEPRRIGAVGVVGAGLMGTGIAAACLDAGLAVTLVDSSLERLEAGTDNIIDIYERQVSRGRLSAEARDTRIARLSGQTDPAAVADADIVIEATTEDAQVKRWVFSALDAVMRRDAILATTTSGIDIDGLAAGTGRPDQVIGLHFIPPAHVIRLCEVVIAMETADEVIAAIFAFLRRLGKLPVASDVSEGYIAGRVQGAYLEAAEGAVAQGAGIAEVDAAMKSAGFALGPFEMADLSGLDIDLARRARFEGCGPGIAARLVTLGRLGRKTGRGYYAYAGQPAQPQADPEVETLLSEVRAVHGKSGEDLSEEEIRRRCLSAMANEGARILEEGIARRPSDIDVAMIAGYGFPRFRGGPMMAADLTGLLRVKRDIDRYAAEDPAFWTPSPIFAELIKNGRNFADLNT